MVNKFVIVFILAIWVRLLIMPFLFHPDLKTQLYHAQFLNQGVVNIYAYLDQYRYEMPYTDTFNYPPLTYLMLGSWNWLIQPFVGNHYQPWINYWGVNWHQNDQLWRQLFVFKFIYLVADLLVAYILIKVVNPVHRFKTLIFWLFNPINLYIIYGIANFDIIVLLFTLASWLAFTRNRYILTGLCLGLAIGLKIYPIVYVPFLIIYLLQQKKWRGLIQLVLSLGITIIVPLIYFYPWFLGISKNGLTNKILELRISIGQLYLPVFILIYIISLVIAFVRSLQLSQIMIYWAVVSLMILSLLHYHPQWWIWPLPFLVISLTNRSASWFWILYTLSFAITILSFGDYYLMGGVLSPLFPRVYNGYGLGELITKILPLKNLAVTGQLLMIGATAYYLFLEWLYPKTDYERH